MKPMKVTINYTGRVEIEIYPQEIADSFLDGPPDDEKIKNEIRAWVGDAAAEREWPSYTINPADMGAAIEAVKAALAESEGA